MQTRCVKVVSCYNNCATLCLLHCREQRKKLAATESKLSVLQRKQKVDG